MQLLSLPQNPNDHKKLKFEFVHGRVSHSQRSIAELLQARTTVIAFEMRGNILRAINGNVVLLQQCFII